MRVMFAAFAACAVIAALAPTVMHKVGYTVEATRASDNVRLDAGN